MLEEELEDLRLELKVVLVKNEILEIENKELDFCNKI